MTLELIAFKAHQAYTVAIRKFFQLIECILCCVRPKHLMENRTEALIVASACRFAPLFRIAKRTQMDVFNPGSAERIR